MGVVWCCVVCRVKERVRVSECESQSEKRDRDSRGGERDWESELKQCSRRADGLEKRLTRAQHKHKHRAAKAQNRAEQSKAKQSRAKQNSAGQRSAGQDRRRSRQNRKKQALQTASRGP